MNFFFFRFKIYDMRVKFAQFNFEKKKNYKLNLKRENGAITKFF